MTKTLKACGAAAPLAFAASLLIATATPAVAADAAAPQTTVLKAAHVFDAETGRRLDDVADSPISR